MGNERADDVPDNWRGRNTQLFQSQATVGRSPAPLPLPDQPRRTGMPSSSDSTKRRDKVDKAEEEDIEQSNVQNSGVLEVAKGGVKDGDKNKAFPTRTYHTIKDMISSRFGSGKLPKDGIGNTEAYSSVGTEAGNKAGENEQSTVMALNNISNASGDGTSKCVNGNARKATSSGRVGSSIQKEDPSGGFVNSEELEISQKQHVLIGGSQQIAALSRNYNGEVMGGTFHSPHITAARLGAGDVPSGRGGDGASVLQKSGKGAQGSCSEQGLYATAQQDRGVEFPVNREYVPAQAQELSYGYQRTHPRLPQGVLDQNGIYMVMRQNGQNYQQAVPVGSKDNQYGLQDQDSEMRRQNIAGVLNFQHAEGCRPVMEGSAVSNYGTPNMVGLVKRDAAGSHSRRGSQSRLDAEDDDDDEGGFVITGSRGSIAANNLRSSNHSVGGENFMKAMGSGNYNQQQSSGQSSDYEKATQRSIGQSSSNADSGRGSTVCSGAHQLVQGGLRGEVSEHLDTSTESSDSPQALSGCREGIYGLPPGLVTG